MSTSLCEALESDVQILLPDVADILNQSTIMIDMNEQAVVPEAHLAGAIETACSRIPPLWPLQNFVAVNPFLGLSGHPFLDASTLMRRVTHGEMMMPLGYYRNLLGSDRITDADLKEALRTALKSFSPEQALAIEGISVDELKATVNEAAASTAQENQGCILTYCDFLDRSHQTQWSAFIVDEVSKWCSAFYDEGQASWRMPWRGEPLFTAWKSAALCDANPEMMGLHEFRRVVASLPDEPVAVIQCILGELNVPPQVAADFLHREMMSVGGWSAYVQYHVREKSMRGQADDTLQHLLAIRLVYELVLYRQSASAESTADWMEQVDSLADHEATGATPSTLLAYLWQLAAENAYQRQLAEKLKSAANNAQPQQATPKERPALQAIFCIDVRSEVYRRALEAAASGIETIGFAGFFAFPIEYVPFGQNHGSAQCPVLLTPKFRIAESASGASAGEVDHLLRGQKFAKRLKFSWNSFKTSAISCFSFVETAGLLSGVNIIKDSLGHQSTLSGSSKTHPGTAPCIHADSDISHAHRAPSHDCGLSEEEQAQLALGALKNMGLTANFARIVLVCGHGSSTVNNPYGSGLDCGACGGHTGEANARVAALVLNSPNVRHALQSHDIHIPGDTYFLAALHNTTTDDVTLFDTNTVPETHQTDMADVRSWLSKASHTARQERAKVLGLKSAPESKVDKKVRSRSRDWAQTRPEWGLAGNAAFIAAPRERTKSLYLGGRTFLHNYDHHSDSDGSILELIMTAPMVVASWINLQYFASTVNNETFGSGNKTIHNVVGTFGVWEGNAGDLQVGLPLQSVHDGTNWRHEPLRLSVFIEAPVEEINKVIARHENVRELLDNNWLHLIAMEDGGRHFQRYCGGLRWEVIEVGI